MYDVIVCMLSVCAHTYVEMACMYVCMYACVSACMCFWIACVCACEQMCVLVQVKSAWVGE